MNMRRSNWKAKILILIAFVIGAAAAIAVAVLLPEKYDVYRGLLSFGTLAVVSVIIVLVGVKIFRIGDD